MESITLQGNRDCSNLDEYLLQKKIELMIDISHKKLNNEMSNIKGMVNKLSEDICELKRQLNESVPTSKTDTMHFDAKEDATQNNVKKADLNKAALRPRYGDYKPEEVSIDRFFYFGSKNK